ncbi:hypothetical protein C5Y11_008420 [Klebsiella pneumoniae subsp. pneumoniae]|nr:hypothetical protein B9468_021865 [Klebsiella pneumoniae]RNX76180.1 hypothetical protein C5Y11_008420 [Klebsiella pneumoniae subsp. pneumoniae]
MRTRHLMALFTGVLILAIILPISLSIWQAARQAKMQFYRELDDYSNRIVVRTLQVADQAREALREADAHTAALSLKHATRRWPWLNDLSRKAPWFSGLLIIVVGIYMMLHGLSGL